ncbi:UNVERIFIED_CONTAM: hypothetical protein FKN15_061081 [Acipenser sinensis]
MDTSTADQSDCEMEMSENRSLDSSCSAGKETTKTSSSKAERTPRAGPEPGEQHRKGAPEEGNPPRTESLDESRVTEAEETEEEEEELSPENDSLLSPSSVSSLSTAESSPEGCRSTGSRSASTPTHKDQEREDKRIKLQAEKEERERAREEAKAAKERAKEEAKKKREEEKEAREKEKREKREKEEREKAEKLLVKEEKRKEKQEALEAKQEEKRKKEEEKRLKEEKEVSCTSGTAAPCSLLEDNAPGRHGFRAADVVVCFSHFQRVKAEKAEIRRFFQKPKTLQAPRTLAAACGKFAPFEIKENMTLAPLTRVLCDQEVLEQLDQYLQAPDRSANGILEWKSRKPRRSGPTSPRTSDCVVLVEGSQPDGVPARQECGRMKLLHFCENYRPAYWGTWRKRSSKIKPRNPLSQDKIPVDSDEEWEEEEPGESLSHSEGDDDDEGGGEAAGDDEDDDGFFVPHGYLSDGEGASEELKAREWDELLSKGRVKVLQAVVLGCVWECEGPPGDTVLRTLRDYAVCVLDTRLGEEAGTPESMSKEKRDDHILSQMLPLLHGNVNGSKAIIREFQECWRGRAGLPSPPDSLAGSSEDSVPSKYRLKRLISESAVYEKRPALRRWCWYVHEAVLKRFSREELPVPCQWSYITQVPYAGREEAGGFNSGTVYCSTVWGFNSGTVYCSTVCVFNPGTVYCSTVWGFNPGTVYCSTVWGFNPGTVYCSTVWGFNPGTVYCSTVWGFNPGTVYCSTVWGFNPGTVYCSTVWGFNPGTVYCSTVWGFNPGTVYCSTVWGFNPGTVYCSTVWGFNPGTVYCSTVWGFNPGTVYCSTVWGFNPGTVYCSTVWGFNPGTEQVG